MRPTLTITLSLLLLGACSTNWSPPPGQTMRVACIDPNGAPVEGAQVTFHGNDANGGAAPVVIAQDAKRIGGRTVNAAEGEPVTVRMWPRRTIRGRVQRPAGRAGPVQVSVIHIRHSWLQREIDRYQMQFLDRQWSIADKAWLPRVDALEASVHADDTFALHAGGAGFVQLAFTGPGLAMTQRTAFETNDELDVVLEPEATLSTTVVDANGKPVAGAEVALTTKPGWQTGASDLALSVRWRRITGADGCASFEGLPADGYLVAVMVPGAPLLTAHWTIAAGEREAVTVRVEPGVMLRGVVRDANGNGVVGVRIQAWMDEFLLSAGSATTDTFGGYELLVPRQSLRIVLAALPDGRHAVDEMHLLDFTRAEVGTHTLDFALMQR